jgi:putative DNA primase/helicase
MTPRSHDEYLAELGYGPTASQDGRGSVSADASYRPECGHTHAAPSAELIPDTLTDRGNAQLFIQHYANCYRHVPGLGWYRWDNTRWRSDEEDTVLWAAGDLAERLAASDPRGIHTTQSLRQHRLHLLSTSGLNAMLQQLRSAPAIVLRPDLLDADPYMLCTPDGLVDLRTGVLRAPDPRKDFHSRSTTVGPRPISTPRWHRFLADTFGDGVSGERMTSFLQLLLGYSITGDVGGEVMPFMFGGGKNGKTVLLEVLMRILGDYADAAPPGFLMARPVESHPTDLAELHGRRIIAVSEVKPGDRLDEARVKFLTDGTRIQARRMRQGHFWFEPTHKLWLQGNHRPEVSTGGYAFWRRIRVIPFDRVVPEDRRVDNLAEILAAEEGPGILKWLIDGAGRYLNGDRDFTGPQRVRIATRTYAEIEDHTTRFFDEHRDFHRHSAGYAHLYSAYRRWCVTECVQAIPSHAFRERAREIQGVASRMHRDQSRSQKSYADSQSCISEPIT